MVYGICKTSMDKSLGKIIIIIIINFIIIACYWSTL